MELVALGALLRGAREASGLSQGDLARLTGISRVTVNYAERGRVAIGTDALLRILRVLGMAISGPDGSARGSALDLLARQASVSYRTPMTAHTLADVLTTGEYAEQSIPHLATMLDEASDAMILRAVRETAAAQGVSPARIWRNVKALAASLQSPHPRWHRAA